LKPEKSVHGRAETSASGCPSHWAKRARAEIKELQTMTEPMSNVNGTIPISSRQMVRFVPNMPVEIALQCTDGVRIAGRYGDRVKYTLADNRTMCVDPFVADRIKELEIQPGELFQVCKRQAKKGNRKTIHWAVERFGEYESQLERDLRESLNRVNVPELARPSAPSPSELSTAAPLASAPPPSPFHELGLSAANNGNPADHGPRNGSGSVQAACTRVSTDEIAPQLPDTQLAHALKTAIAAAVDAEEFGKTLNYNIRFSTEDVRSMGITILIGMQQRTPR
jgi:hypothetical protein